SATTFTSNVAPLAEDSSLGSPIDSSVSSSILPRDAELRSQWIRHKMGGHHSQFTEEQLKDYQELTYFTQKEILHCHKRFSQLDPEAVKINANAKLPSRKIMTLPELRVNPFKDRICKVFSSSKDGELTFEDFLDMMSVFSENAPKSVKVEYAFRIYDFNEDDYICENDLKRVIQRLCGEQRLSDDNVNALIQKLF
ncbi:Calcium and integrin-binding protein 1, partial [Acropora cervicornis]